MNKSRKSPKRVKDLKEWKSYKSKRVKIVKVLTEENSQKSKIPKEFRIQKKKRNWGINVNCELFTSPLLILLISSSFCFSILLSSHQGQTRRHVSEFTSLFNLRHSATDLKSKFFSCFIDRFSFHHFHSFPSTQGYWKVQIYSSKTRYLTWFK